MTMKGTFFLKGILIIALLGFAASAIGAEGFPLRAKYPDVKVMSTDALNASYDDTIVVDVRSTMEFDVAHVSKAAHVPIAQATFASDLEKVRAKNASTPMAFYCNGHTCAKSYQAAVAAQEAGFTNVFAYDAGIFDWIMAQPDKATLMGKTPAPQDKIIPKSKLEAKMLSPDEFMAKAAQPNTVNVDIRDPFQREKIPAIPLLRNIPLDRLTKLFEKGQFKDKQHLIIDLQACIPNPGSF
jgi:rhodanese-related sulfurtransferase